MNPKKAFDDHKRHAEHRNIPFLLSYAEWLEMWLVSGKWKLRGKNRGQFQMCRKRDLGGYSTKNCYIGSVEQNQNDRSIIANEKVYQIVDMYLNTNMTQYEVADYFNIDQSHVSRLVSGKRRKYAKELNE